MAQARPTPTPSFGVKVRPMGPLSTKPHHFRAKLERCYLNKTFP